MEPSSISTLQNTDPGKYLLVIDGKPQGPFTIGELKERHIKPGDFVRTPAMDDYKEAHEVAELRELFGFKTKLLVQYYGSFDQRLTASVIDWFFVTTACTIITLVIALLNSPEFRLPIAMSLLVTIPLTKLIYHIIMECSVKQATYGKQIIGIKVCDLNGARITPIRSVWRNVAKIFSVLPAFIGYIYSFFSQQQQCLHDMLAGTLVIKDRLF